MYEGRAKIVKISNDNWNKVMAGKMHIDVAMDDILDDDLEDYHVVLGNWMDLSIADLNGNLIAIPIHVDYVSAQVDNYEFDLDKLLEKLKKDSRVLNNTELKIKPIPYYNCDDNRNTTIDFKVLISNEDYEKYKALGPSFRRYEYLLNEILNCKDCRKTHED